MPDFCGLQCAWTSTRHRVGTEPIALLDGARDGRAATRPVCAVREWRALGVGGGRTTAHWHGPEVRRVGRGLTHKGQGREGVAACARAADAVLDACAFLTSNPRGKRITKPDQPHNCCRLCSLQAGLRQFRGPSTSPPPSASASLWARRIPGA